MFIRSHGPLGSEPGTWTDFQHLRKGSQTQMSIGAKQGVDREGRETLGN